jgi:hypothetical protein
MKDIKYTLNADANGDFVSATVDGKPASIYQESNLPADEPTLLKMVGKDMGGGDIKLVQYRSGLTCMWICGILICG